MENIMKKLTAAVLGAGLLAANSAHAALDFTGVDVNIADVETVMGLAIGGLVAIWGFRKVIKVLNRS
jgi:ABC-type proline/glycine betaine transport system substrate-binding protein